MSLPRPSLNAEPLARRPSACALLVEGSGVASELLKRVLQTALCEAVDIHVVATPQAAPRDVSGFQLALIDIDLDDQAARMLLHRLPPSCWRVATTLYDEEDRLLPALQVGVQGYLLKQDRYERQVEGLQRILRGYPEVSPSMARSLLEALRSGGRLPAAVEQTLDGLGRGSSLKEVARALSLKVEDVQAHVAQAFDLMRQADALA